MSEQKLKEMIEASAEELTEMRWKKIKEIQTNLDELKNLESSVDPKEAKALRKREKEDYKRFFSVVNKPLGSLGYNINFWRY